MSLYNIARINNTLDHTHKYLCVFGCLLTQDGIAIKEEMLAWLEKYYHVFCVDQRPPGALFEYPAIFYAAQLSIDTQNPVLYIYILKGQPIETIYNAKFAICGSENLATTII